MSSIRKQFLTTYAAEGVNFLSGLVYAVIAARALGPDGRGMVGAIWTSISIGLLISGLGISKSLVSRLNDNKQGIASADYFGALLVLLPILSGLALAVILCILPEFPDQGQLILWATLVTIVPTMVAADFARAVLRARRRILLLNLIVATTAVFRVGLLGLLWSLGQLSVMSALIVEFSYWILIGLLSGAAILSRLSVKPCFQRIPASVQSLISYGLAFQFFSICVNLINKLHTPYLSFSASPKETGYFFVAVRQAEYLGVLSNQLLLVAVPFLAQKSNRKDALRDGLKITRMSLLVLIPVAVILEVFAEVIIILLYGDSFAPAVTVFRLMVVGVVFQTLFQSSAMAAVAQGKLKIISVCAVFGFIVNGIMMFALTPLFGAQGSALAACAGHLTSFLSYLVVLKVYQGVPISDILIPRKVEILAVLKRRRAGD